MFERSKKKVPANQNHMYAIYFFVGVCAIATLVAVFSGNQKIEDRDIIDDTQILVHNGQGHQFKHGPNELFQHLSMADARKMFTSALSDTNQIDQCASSVNPEMPEDQQEEIEVPDEYDWRKEYPNCVQPTRSIGQNCSSSYAFASLSAVEDRICMSKQETV